MAKPEEKKSAPTVWSLVLVPAALTLVVTILRLTGELMGWNERLFGTGMGPDQPGMPKMGLFGITWLILLFGLWFGFRVRRQWGGPHLGKALGLFLGGIVVMFGGMFAMNAAGMISFPDNTPGAEPVEPKGLMWMMILMAVVLVVGFAAWRRLAFVLLVYAILARVPVVLVTYLSVMNRWTTHYARQAPGFAPKEGFEKFVELMMPQISFWPVLTVLAGGALGCLGGLLAGKPKGS